MQKAPQFGQLPQRRKLALRLIGLLLLVTGFAFWGFRESRWMRLPTGSQMLVYKVDPGPLVSASYTPTRFKLLNWLSPAVDIASDIIAKPPLRSAWWRIVGPRKIDHAYRIHEGEMVVWLLNKGPAEPRFTRCWLLMPDGQEFLGFCSLADSNENFRLCEIKHSFIPKSQPQVRLRLETEDKAHAFTFEAPNALYTRSIPQWEAKPLPQTVRVGNLEVTLHAVTTRHIPMPSSNSTTWLADADIRLRMLNGEQTSWYDFWTTFCDPEGHESHGTGVFSQPVWKVRFQITARPEHPQFGSLKPSEAHFYVKPPPPPPAQQITATTPPMDAGR